jgi:hypothetical protein
MVSDVRGAKARLVELQDFVREVMIPDEDFGIIPGTKKPVLLKPGAEKLCEIYGYAQRVEVVNRIEDWSRPFFHYEVRVDLVSKRSGAIVGAGIGSCNSMEARYRWRDASRKCPKCQAEAIIKGKEEYGGGYLCFAKKGGCGAKFKDTDTTITDQSLARIENDDVYTIVNTILKMAKKRALVDATLSVTRSSGVFTQDEEAIEASAGPARRATTTVQAAVDAHVTAADTITKADAKRLLQRAEAAGHTTVDVLAWLDVRGLGEVKRADLDAILLRVDNTTPLSQPVEGMKTEAEIPFDL